MMTGPFHEPVAIDGAAAVIGAPARSGRNDAARATRSGYDGRPMDGGQTTLSLQRYLNELGDLRGELPTEPIVRALLGRAARRLHVICESMLRRSYPRLARGPMNLEAEELLGGVVERLLKAMREIRPENVRQFFALANRHLRWELNDLARRLDQRREQIGLPTSEPAAAERPEGDALSTPATCRILEAIARLPEKEGEAFNLVRVQGVSWAEAASIVGVSETTVKRRVGRSLVLLAAMLPDLKPN